MSPSQLMRWFSASARHNSLSNSMWGVEYHILVQIQRIPSSKSCRIIRGCTYNTPTQRHSGNVYNISLHLKIQRCIFSEKRHPPEIAASIEICGCVSSPIHIQYRSGCVCLSHTADRYHVHHSSSATNIVQCTLHSRSESLRKYSVRQQEDDPNT